LQRFSRVDLSAEGVPDATNLLNFRQLLETRGLCQGHCTAINADFAARGLLLRERPPGQAPDQAGQPVVFRNESAHRREVRGRGLAKNGHQHDTLFALANVAIGARARGRREKREPIGLKR
jgi:hypothetical protein